MSCHDSITRRLRYGQLHPFVVQRGSVPTRNAAALFSEQIAADGAKQFGFLTLGKWTNSTATDGIGPGTQERAGYAKEATAISLPTSTHTPQPGAHLTIDRQIFSPHGLAADDSTGILMVSVLGPLFLLMTLSGYRPGGNPSKIHSSVAGAGAGLLQRIPPSQETLYILLQLSRVTVLIPTFLIFHPITKSQTQEKPSEQKKARAATPNRL
ncbi:hypothetical protein MKZ38_005145 [Zalerion maritima]|uniref:Uncharacterized protein n=1 Tax=Zalerion maritima TaxID=339359 RepID=A0AAD5RLH8_9PEZI|nr:hypothetical protein MKZ38_005145 [Zalerion maritima]